MFNWCPATMCACFLFPRPVTPESQAWRSWLQTCLRNMLTLVCVAENQLHTHTPSRCTETLHTDVWEWIIPHSSFASSRFPPLSQSLCRGPASSSQWLNDRKLTSNLLGWHGADCCGMLWLPLHLPLMCYWWLHHRRIAIVTVNAHWKCMWPYWICNVNANLSWLWMRSTDADINISHAGPIVS